MAESKCEKYLVHNSGGFKPNVARRLSRGWGRISEILAIIQEAPLDIKIPHTGDIESLDRCGS